ncbi:hypothetical protein YWS52_10060 [Chitiniphilus shinanonensis]
MIAPPRPLPTEYAAACPAPVNPTDNSPDAIAMALKQLYDQYGQCAGRLVDLVDYLTQPER